jgi:hypothetical protein
MLRALNRMAASNEGTAIENLRHLEAAEVRAWRIAMKEATMGVSIQDWANTGLPLARTSVATLD